MVDLTKVKAACQTCNLYQLCLPLGLEQGDIEKLDSIIHRSKPLPKGAHLFQIGEPFEAIYAIRSGSVKTFTVTDEGEEQITGFHLPGEIVGLDAISSGAHHCAAKTLETTSICKIPYDRIQDLSSTVPSLGRQLMRIMSNELIHDQDHVAMLSKKSADQRLASLLVGFSERYRQRGYSGSEFNLTMSRNDLGNYLGLAVETVSRIFTRLQDQEILTTERKFIAIHDLGKLKEIAGMCDGPHSPH